MLRKVHEARIAALARTDAALVDRQEALIGALADDQPCHGLFVDMTARRLATLGVERAAVARELSDVGAKLMTANRHAASAEKLLARIQAVAGDAAERRRLEDLASPRHRQLPASLR